MTKQQVSLDDLAAEKLLQAVLTSLQHVLIEGMDLVEQSNASVFVGIIDGQLIAKTQMRLPLRKTVLLVVSLAVLAWFVAPYLAHLRLP